MTHRFKWVPPSRGPTESATRFAKIAGQVGARWQKAADNETSSEKRQVYQGRANECIRLRDRALLEGARK